MASLLSYLSGRHTSGGQGLCLFLPFILGTEHDIWLMCACPVTQSGPTVCDSMDCSQRGSSVHGLLQARILEWVAIAFCRGSSQPRDITWVSCLVGGFFTTQPPEKPMWHIRVISRLLFNVTWNMPLAWALWRRDGGIRQIQYQGLTYLKELDNKALNFLQFFNFFIAVSWFTMLC